MEIHFLVVDKSWKIIVEKEWSPIFVEFCYFFIVGTETDIITYK